MKKKSTKEIPKGMYCYNVVGHDPKTGRLKTKNCPYWKILRDRPEHQNGWCDYLGKGDLELANEGIERENAKIRKRENGKLGRWRKMTREELEDSASLGLFGLLFDGCKECKVKKDFD